MSFLAKLPERQQPTVDAIYRSYEEKQDDGWRPHLGASIIGKECDRSLWYDFRWATKIKHTGRLLRLFQTGHLQEDRLIADLRAAGIQVWQYDEETGSQFTVSAVNGHFGGSMDSVGIGFPEAPKTPHLIEYKTHSLKSFNDLKAKGVYRSKPQHYAQMQIYMLLGGFERAFYLAVCKDNDELYSERIRLDEAHARGLVSRAERIVRADVPPERLSADETFYLCRFCTHSGVCHHGEFAPRHCRTCAHATPAENGAWLCEKHGKGLTVEAQKAGCQDHLYIPPLVPGEQIDAAENYSWVEYKLRNGVHWKDGKDEQDHAKGVSERSG